MHFVPYSELVRDVYEWKLPSDIVAVCGVPRSGTLVAALIAQHRGLHLVDMHELIEGDEPWRRPLRRVRAKGGGRVLLVDDSVNTGGTFGSLPPLPSNVVKGAVYGRDEDSAYEHVLLIHRVVPVPRIFEWNLWSHSLLPHMMLDLDGVICRDWTTGRAVDHPELYAEHLAEAAPLHLPKLNVRAIVTGRTEQDRIETSRWLARHRVGFDSLQMRPTHMQPAEFKANAYDNDRKARLFVESDLRQADAINRHTRKPVLCTHGGSQFEFLPALGRHEV